VARWSLARSAPDNAARERWFAWFVVGTLLIAAAGLVIGWGPRPAIPANVPLLAWRMRLMKFYPFRLADVFVPIAVAMTLAARWVSRPSDSSDRRLVVVGRVALLALLVAGLWNATKTQFRPHVPPERIGDWRDVCAWIRAETPQDALFLTPNEAWAFRWFAQRAEYVSFKDCPQDAPGILEWNRRLKLIQQWFDDEWNGGLSAAALERLHAETGITHVLLRGGKVFDAPADYRNGAYAVYRTVK
jgi:hypothetical protein